MFLEGPPTRVSQRGEVDRSRWIRPLRPLTPTLPQRKGRLDLVLFDMDGTLVDKHSSWELIHRSVGVSNEENWKRYARGELDDLGFMRSDIELWRRKGKEFHVEEIEEILEEAEIMEGARECVRALKERGILTGILTGGLDLLAERVGRALDLDFYVANGIRLKADGRVDGEGILFVEIRDKGTPTRNLLKVWGIPKEKAAAVGNAQWDVPMFREVGFSVCVNPHDDVVSRFSHRTVERKDLREVASLLLRYDEEGPP